MRTLRAGMTFASQRGIDELAELVGNGSFHRAGDTPLVCHHCRRDLRDCIEQHRGPITIQRCQIDAQHDGLRPVCEHCKAGRAEARPAQKRRERERDTMSKQINWREPMRDGEPPLWVVANQLHEKVKSWSRVAICINDEYGLNVIGASCSGVVRSALKAGVSPGPMPMPEFVATATATASSPPDPLSVPDEGGNGNGEGNGSPSAEATGDLRSDGAATAPRRSEGGSLDPLPLLDEEDDNPFGDGGEDGIPDEPAVWPAGGSSVPRVRPPYEINMFTPDVTISVSTSNPAVFRHVVPMVTDALAEVE